MINQGSKIYIAGHNGMVGSSCLRILSSYGYNNIFGLNSEELDLRNQYEVNYLIKNEKPDIIINSAAKVGGILANDTYQYDFLMDNMLIQNNLIDSAVKYNISKFIFLGSSCIYPKFSKQPIKEKYLLTDSLEPTNQWYAIAKISGVKLIEAIRNNLNKDYVSLMPTNLFGPNDNFDLKTSHVLPAMIRKFHDAKVNKESKIVLWGSGSPLREFLYVDDLAEAVLFAIENKLSKPIYNIGSGTDLSINDLSKLIKKCIGYRGKIIWDNSMPDGTPRKLLDSSKFNKIGWKPKINLKKGIDLTYKWYLDNL